MKKHEFPIQPGNKPKPLSLVFKYEDELPELKPPIYDAMFPISFVHIVRVFPAVLIDDRLFYLVEMKDAMVTK